jgi:hypothetical protein
MREARSRARSAPRPSPAGSRCSFPAGRTRGRQVP